MLVSFEVSTVAQKAARKAGKQLRAAAEAGLLRFFDVARRLASIFWVWFHARVVAPILASR
jgi:hypothetical protein